ncbi:MAG: PAS domain S-box protein [Novosphingobium sp.]
MDSTAFGQSIGLEAYLGAVLETLPDMLLVLDCEFRTLAINPAGLAAIGAGSLDEALGLKLAALMSPQDIAALRTSFDAALLGVDAPAAPVCVTITRADKSACVLECRLARLVGAAGKVEGVLIRAQDITACLAASRDAEDNTALVRAVLATVPSAMVVTDEHGRITLFSSAAQEMFGYREDEVLGRNVSLLMPSPHREAHDGYIARYLETGERRIIGIGRVVEGLRKDGSIFPTELSVGEARSGEHRAFTGFHRDLTAQIETEARLHQMQSELAHASRLSAVGTLASALAHEINQPLAAIANYLSAGQELLDADRPNAREIVRDALEAAANEALRAGQIVHRLRGFVARGEVDSEIFSLKELIDEAATLGLVGTRARSVDLEVVIDPEVDCVVADRIQIQQVLVNLMRNAVEAMEHSPVRRIVVRAMPGGEDRVELVVADSGPGIAPALVGELFKPFTGTKGKGMGLGLSICRTIVEAHGGKLTVEPSEAGGTQFRFTVLRALPDAPLGF